MFVLTRLKAQSTEFEASAFIGIPMGDVKGATSAKYSFGQLFVGGDLGYAISTSKGNDGVFLFQPRFGYDGTSFDAFAFYKGISSKHNIGYFGKTLSIRSIGAGFAYKF